MVRWTVRILGAAILAVLLFSFVISATVAESALHPLLRRRASDTAALAVSAAHAAGGEATQISITGRGNVTLKAWWIMPQKWNRQVVITCHGVADSGFGAMGDALLFARNGYAVLVPDSRGHGESGGMVTYGVYESEDIVLWLKWIRTEQPQNVYGFGESLGGSIILASLGRGAQFRAVIAESPYAYFEQVACERVVKYGKVSNWLARVFVKEALLYVLLAHHVDLTATSPAEAVRQSSVPILLIHGMDDRETLPVHSKEIYRAAKYAQLWLVPKAGHTGAYAADPRQFESRVLAFFASPSS